MAKASPILITALRNTAELLRKTNTYQWGHMGSCNCGHLAQQLTMLSSREIHARAMQKYGDWSEQLNDYCPTSGLLMDDLLTEMFEAGLDQEDLRNLEKLSDPAILRHIPAIHSPLRHNLKADVIRYIETWARILENEWLSKQSLPEQLNNQALLKNNI